MKLKLISMLALGWGWAIIAQASGPVAPSEENIVQFSTQVEKEVSYDLMQVRLYIQEENNNLKTLNQSISDKLNRALTTIKQQKNIELKDSSSSNQVRYDNKSKQNGWIGRAEIVIESQDFAALGQLLTELNPYFAISNMQPLVSSSKRNRLEKEMLEEALSQFKNKANLIQTSLNATSYQIINLELNTPDEQIYYPLQSGYAAQMRSVEAAEPPTLESGKTSLKARVEAKIKLVNN